MGALKTRVKQGLCALTSPASMRGGTEGPPALTPRQRAAFHCLSRFDQAHAVTVRDRLVTNGVTTSDLEIAALLHDIGKGGTAAQPGRVRLIHRVAMVLLSHLPSPVTGWLWKVPAPRWRAGFALARNHPMLGAAEARRLGCSDRTCWLIQHHHDGLPVADAELRRLIVADEAADAGVD